MFDVSYAHVLQACPSTSTGVGEYDFGVSLALATSFSLFIVLQVSLYHASLSVFWLSYQEVGINLLLQFIYYSLINLQTKID